MQMHLFNAPLGISSIRHSGANTVITDRILVGKQRAGLHMEDHQGLREMIMHTHISKSRKWMSFGRSVL